MSSNAKISIIVPVYNQEKYLDQCMNSILSQTYDDFECILVDDGSKDKSPEMCDQYAQKDKRVKVVHKENGGLTSARKAGFDVCNSEYVCFLDSDDYLHPDFLKLNINAITVESDDVCTCGHYQDFNGTIISNTFVYPVKKIEKENITKDYVLPVIGKIYADGYLNYPGYVWGRIYKTRCIPSDCFVSEREVYTEDDLLQMYLSSNISKAIFIPEKLVYYRVNELSLTHAYRQNMWSMLKNRHRYVIGFFKEKCIPEQEDRLIASGFYAIYVTLRNAYEAGNFIRFKMDLKEMLTDEFSFNVLKSLKYELLKPRQKLMAFLLKRKLYLTLYYSKNLLFR